MVMLILTDQLIILLGLRYLRAVRDQTRWLGLPSAGHFVCDRHREWHGQRRARGHLRQGSVARGLRACTGRGLRPRPVGGRRRGCRRGPCVGRDMLLMRDMILNDTIRTLDGWTRTISFPCVDRAAPVRLVAAEYSWTFFLLVAVRFCASWTFTYFMHYMRHGYLPIF